ncbi:hypothetical protein ABEX25_07205 [Paenibacillus thiaminolyticus]|uniref:hypothetical protein n=1 Tax=Paenibacillus thiaminolyticus TaxID=49283 RepID=UPI003D2A5F15
MGEHPSTNYLKALDKPILILQGDKDFHGYKHILGDKPNATFKRYANLNHLFMPSVYGGEILKAKKEYKVPQHVDKQVINDISDWLRSF